MRNNGPLVLHRETVQSGWIDYNGHMNLAYYVLVFDHATDALMDHVGLDAAYRETTNGSLFVVESHVTYGAEVMLDEEMEIATHVLDVDAKRLRLFHEMFVDREGSGPVRAATNELMILHVDLGQRRTTPFAEPILAELTGLCEAHADLPRPPEAGRAITFEKR